MSGFYPDTFDFLKTLQANNHKAWFDENRQNYEYQVRGPALDFIEAFSYNLSSAYKRSHSNSHDFNARDLQPFLGP